MNHTTAACAARTSGVPCDRPAQEVEPIPLCGWHRVEVAASVANASLTEHSLPAAAIQAERAVVEGRGQHDPVVYFLGNGNRIKIGTTVNLSKRTDQLSLRMEDVALTLTGGRPLESALHRHFRAHRIGTSEWFEDVPALRAYMLLKLMQPSHPMTAVEPVVSSATLDADIVEQAATEVVRHGIASATMLQRRMGIGYARASRIIAFLERAGVAPPLDGPGCSRASLYRPGQEDAARQAVRSLLASRPHPTDPNRTVNTWETP